MRATVLILSVYALLLLSITVSGAQTNQAAKRIISLSPNLTEILCEIGAQQQIIARDKNSNYPLSVTKIPILSDYFKANIEHILAMHPDLIVVESSSFLYKDLNQLKKRHITIYVSKTTNLESISRTMLDLGVLTGHQSVSQQQASHFRNQIDLLTHKYASRKKIKVFYELWNRPLMTVNNQTLIGEMICRCAGQNIFAALPIRSPHVSLESVIKNNPQAIISSFQGFQGTWTSLSVRNVLKSDLFYISPDIIERSGPRILQGFETLCDFLDSERINLPN